MQGVPIVPMAPNPSSTVILRITGQLDELISHQHQDQVCDTTVAPMVRKISYNRHICIVYVIMVRGMAMAMTLPRLFYWAILHRQACGNIH